MQIDMRANIISQETIDDETLKTMLENHRIWLQDNKKGKRADFSNTNLSEKDLSNLDLSYAIFSGARLMKTNLAGSNLSYADFTGARIHNVNIQKTNLNEATFMHADLTHSDLSECSAVKASFVNACLWDNNFKKSNLENAGFLFSQPCDCDFSECNLDSADFVYADLDNADFTNADLRNVCFDFAERIYWCQFSGADLTDASFEGCDVDIEEIRKGKGYYIPCYCPEEGSFIAWKKCRDEKIVKLLITEEASRKGTSRKRCCASEAIVLEVFDKDWKSTDEAVGVYDEEFKYVKGERVVAAKSGVYAGIYFFLSKEDAKRFKWEKTE